MVKAALFDMDGVLAFTERYYNRRRVEYLRGQGFELGDVDDWTGVHYDESWERCVPGDAALRERLRAGYNRFADEHPTPWGELGNRHAHATFVALRDRGVRIAICSSSPRFLIEECMEALDLGDLTDYVISGDECVAHKPDPEIYLRAMRHLRVSPEESVVVEDSPTGIRAGKAAGALVCALRQPDGVLLDQREADLVMDDLFELVDLVGERRVASLA